MTAAGGREAARQQALALVLLWLAGIALRLTILALPPVIAPVRDEFGLNATQVGLLGSIAPALFAIAALAGSLVVARLGVRSALLGGLALVALGAALRGLAGDYATLLLTTTLMCIGVAIMQPVMPSAVREWLPGRIALATAVYTNGLLVGELIPVMSAPWLLPQVGGSWRATLAAWAIPVVLIALLFQRRAPRRPSPASAIASPRKWLPDWRSPLVWRFGILFGCINTIYFSANTFLPVYLASTGRSELIAASLTALNFGQIPASALLLVLASPLQGRVWPYLASAGLSLLGLAGVVWVGSATVAWAALLGFSDAVALILGLTLPAMLCKPQDVARTTAGAFTISYGSALLLALASGAVWDGSGTPALAFAPLALCALAMMVVAGSMRRHRELR